MPLCSLTINGPGMSYGGPGGDTGPLTGVNPSGPNDVASRHSTILVTKKTPVIILQTPAPTLDFGGLVKTVNLVSAPAIGTPGMPSPSPDQESPPTAVSILAAIIQSIFDDLPSPPTTSPTLPSDQSPPNNSPADTTPQPGDTTPSDLPPLPPTSTTINNIPLEILPSAIIIGTQTFAPPSEPTPVLISGQTFTLSPSQVLAPGGLILPLPLPSPPPATPTTIAGLPILLAASSAIIGSQTYTFGPNHPPLTTLIAGQLLTIGPTGIIFASTTLLPIPPSPALTIAGTPLAIGPDAPLTTVTIDGVPIAAGPDGLVFPGTTIPPPGAPRATAPFSAVTVDGLVLSVASGEVYVSGTEYTIGWGATPTTVVVGGETVVAGLGGVVGAGAPTGRGGEGVLGSGGGGVRRRGGWMVRGGVVVGVLGGLGLV
ncbi:hypothetical protein MMC17_001680 [Xylographa soralifera]|nr:hypothetical protein [Xylographa soralifera]